MARPSRGPTEAELGEYAARRVRTDTGELRPWTYQEIADDWHQRTGVRLTRQEIGRKMREAGHHRGPDRHNDVIPWSITTTHHHDYWIERLRLLARHLIGEELRPDQTSKIRGMKTKLARAERDLGCPVSVSYDPSRGFSLVPRESWHHQVDEDVWVVPPTDPR